MPPAEDNPNDGANWAIVTRKKGKGKPVVAQRPLLEEDLEGPAKNPNHSLEDLKEAREKARQTWRANEFRTKFMEFMRGVVQGEAPKEEKQACKLGGQVKAISGMIQKAVCLGLGTVELEAASVRAASRAFTQLEAFLDVVGLLEEIQENTIHCYFQDPRFSSVEVEHIRGMGHEVLEHPAGIEIIDENTFFFGPYLSWGALLSAIERRPGIIMGNDLGWVVENMANRFSEEHRKIAGDILKAYNTLRVPGYQGIIDGYIYWRANEGGN